MSKPYAAAIYIGRFQPLHNIHLEIIKRAALLANKIIVIIGSDNQARTYKNPFTSAERALMISSASRELGINDNLQLEFNPDSIYNDQAWAVRIQAIVAKHAKAHEKIAIIGHKKDFSSFYFDLFPQWQMEDVGEIEVLNASNIRDLFFKADTNLNFLKSVVPASTFDFLNQFKNTDDFRQIIREREFIATYQQQFQHTPYAPVFVTADTVVIQSGHVLMIKRRAEPGKGLWAFPGGFLDAQHDRSIKDCAIRKLKAETGIKVPTPALYGNIVDNRVFDAVDRSARGRTITHAFKIVLPDGELPKVKGLEHAEKASWIPIAELQPAACFEDHYEILQNLIGN
ncbi:MAG: bifunctional nicotinamide-nucleotide adenylyltransferase/Nudix hydroxylase [Methylococcaceae bacterium]|jgi:bifunctional NMN adenylyltransferase/nudix hydrolase